MYLVAASQIGGLSIPVTFLNKVLIGLNSNVNNVEEAIIVLTIAIILVKGE